MKRVLCITCNQIGHFSCQKAERKHFHIDFEEEPVTGSDDENLFSNYTLKDMKRDERNWRNRSESSDGNGSIIFDEEDGIHTNLVNNKQIRKLKNLHGVNIKPGSKYYNFPTADYKCTESQLYTKF
jgi:hypothetical protein